MMLDTQRAELLRRLSHDLRSPLNVLQGALDELAAPAGPDDQADRARAISLARRALSRLSRLTERLSLAARVDQGVQPSREQVELRPLLQRCWEQLQLAEPRSKIALTLIGEAAWQTDRTLLAALASELLVNALKHARSSVTVQLEGPTLSVEDDGAGVEEALVPTLFTTVQARRAGLGLGLPMAAQLAAALDITLSLEKAGHGALCRFVARWR